MRALWALLLLGACSDASAPVECGSNTGLGGSPLLPGPGQPGFDADLARLAHQYDRQFHAINARGTDLNTELIVSLTATRTRALIETWLQGGEGFDLVGDTGTAAASLGSWSKATGAYAGAGLAADAFRYGVLRDSGESCADVAVAREQLVRGLEALHRTVIITGHHGVIARSVINARLPMGGIGPVTPLFDASGAPLPAEKDNGTWRDDFSGEDTGWLWEDSISRDMLIGWTLGLGPAWEVIEDDDGFSADLKARLAADALAIAQELRVVRASGHDLEIIDADGRITFHGYLNEFAFERGFYLEQPENGFHASLALGVVSVLAMVSGDAGIRSYLIDELVRQRKLPEIAASSMLFNELDEMANFSSYNMSFTGMFLSMRYIDDAAAEAVLKRALQGKLYDVPGKARQPVEQKQTFYDFVYAAGMAGRTRTAQGGELDAGAITRGTETLREFPRPPYWEKSRTNCDEAEIAAMLCTLDDGTVVHLLGDVGRGEKLVSLEPIPMRVRPPSNYWWRSNPYQPNGTASGTVLYPAPDFRVAYWMGRWIR